MSGKSSSWVYLSAIILWLGASAGAEDKVKFGKISPEEWSISAPADYPEADAVVIFSMGLLEIKSENLVLHCHFRIKVLTEAGVEKVGNHSFRWNDEYDKVKKFSAQTITPDGKKFEVEKSAVFNKTYGNYVERSFSFPSVKPGCILEYSYTIINESFRYLNPWYFQTDVYTLRSSYSVAIPPGYVYNVLYQNVPPMFREPRVEEHLDMDGNLSLREMIKTFTWEQRDLYPITDEPYMSSELDYRSSLRFQIVNYEYRGFKYDFWEGWDKKAEVMEKHLADYLNATGEVRKLAEQITSGLSTPAEKSRAIYNHLVTEYRTTNEYTYGYFDHERMSGVLETKSGSGEEKNLLLAQLHKDAGIPAWSVMISTRDNAKLDPDYPDLRQFDYLITFVQLGSEYEFLDCSSRLTPYGLLPPNCLVEGGLLLDGKESQLVKVRGKVVYSGRTDQTTMSVGEDGLVACSTLCSFRGYHASTYGERYDRTTPEEFVRENFLDKLNSEYQLGNHECRLDSGNIFVMTADYTAPDLMTRLDNNLVIRPVGYAFRNNPFESERRFFPVDFNYPFTYKNVVSIHVADSVGQYLLPRDTTITIPGASYARQLRQNGSSVIMSATLVIDKPEFLPAAYSQLRSFFDQVARFGEDDITAVLATSIK